MNRPYDKSQQDSVVQRVRKYAGQKMNCSYSNPCITKREAIALADYIISIEKELAKIKAEFDKYVEFCSRPF